MPRTLECAGLTEPSIQERESHDGTPSRGLERRLAVSGYKSEPYVAQPCHLHIKHMDAIQHSFRPGHAVGLSVDPGCHVRGGVDDEIRFFLHMGKRLPMQEANNVLPDV